jgi:hypothetical protein
LDFFGAIRGRKLAPARAPPIAGALGVNKLLKESFLHLLRASESRKYSFFNHKIKESNEKEKTNKIKEHFLLVHSCVHFKRLNLAYTYLYRHGSLANTMALGRIRAHGTSGYPVHNRRCRRYRG